MSGETWEFTKRDNKSYTLLSTNEDGQRGKFIAGWQLITAPTDQVQIFVLTHFDAFTAPFQLKRTAKVQQ